LPVLEVGWLVREGEQLADVAERAVKEPAGITGLP